MADNMKIQRRVESVLARFGRYAEFKREKLTVSGRDKGADDGFVTFTIWRFGRAVKVVEVTRHAIIADMYRPLFDAGVDYIEKLRAHRDAPDSFENQAREDHS